MRIEVFAFFIITRSLRFLPYEKAKSLNPDDLKPMASNVMGEKTISELMKTGNLLSQEPWGLLKTEQWLSDLCSRNQERKFADPIPLKFIFEPIETLLAIHLPPQDMSAEPVAQAPRPRQVEIVRPKKKAKAAPGMRRPGGPLLHLMLFRKTLCSKMRLQVPTLMLVQLMKPLLMVLKARKISRCF